MVAESTTLLTEHPLSGASPVLKRRLFTLSLLLTTVIPMVFFIAVGFYGTPNRGLQATKATLLFVGGFHVAATLCLYIDHEFLRLIRQNPLRYVHVPLAVSIGSGVLFALGGLVTQAYFLLVFWAWQAYHYGRQNIGVYSFASMAQGWRVDPAERRVLELTIACGMCGTFKILGSEVAPGYLHGIVDGLYRVGSLAFVGALILSVSVYFTRRRDASLTRTALFFTLTLFFAPIFVSTDIDVAFSSYAIAHGLQYLVFMTVLGFKIGTSEDRRGLPGRLALLVALVMLFGAVSYWTPDLKEATWTKSSVIFGTALDFVVGMTLGITIAHFVVDAGAWRLSQPSARHYVATRFGFLFRSPGLDRALEPSSRARA